MRHILLYEPDPSGHRMVFVRYVVQAMARHGAMRATLVTSPRGRHAPWVAAMRAEAGKRLSLLVLDDPAPPLRGTLPSKLSRQVGHSRQLKGAVRALHGRDPIDHVLIPFVDDYCLLPFALQSRPFGSLPWSGIAIRPRFHLRALGADVPPRREDRIEGWAYRRLLAGDTLATLFSIDPYLALFLGDPRLVTVCDPADITDFPAERGWLPVRRDAVVLLVYGYVDTRKAIDRLLTIVADPRVPPALTVALVGVQDPALAPLLQGPVAVGLREEGRLVEIARRVSDEEEASAFARADIVWGYYPGNYCSSGAMVRAGQMGRALMATREGLVGRLVAEHGTGLTAPEQDDAALAAQLVRLAQDAALRRALGEAGRRHFGGDTGQAFGDRIVARLAAGAGVGAGA